MTGACNPKMIFKICQGILCSSFSVKELDVIVHKKIFPYITLFILYPTSLAKLVVEVGTRHSHQILLTGSGINLERSHASQKLVDCMDEM